jgi:hypothetical protein
MRRQMRAVKESVSRPASVCTPRYALKKARAGVKLNRWELEGVSDNPAYALEYAQNVVRGPWEPGEAAIIRSSNCSLNYARDVVRGRWEKGEAVISGCAHASLAYASGVVGGRWERGEATILTEFECAVKYAKTCVKGRWTALEDSILVWVHRNKDWDWVDPVEMVTKYLKAVGGVRWSGLESVLMEKNRAKLTYRYAVLTGGRLVPELHQKMMMFSFDNKRSVWSKRYLRFLEVFERRAIRYMQDLDSESRAELISKFQRG